MRTVLCEMMNLGSWSVKQSLNCGYNGLSTYNSRASNAPYSVWGLSNASVEQNVKNEGSYANQRHVDISLYARYVIGKL